MNTSGLQVHNLCRNFETKNGRRSVLKDLSLTVSRGERIVLFGPSGCGKTTLLHLMALLDQPTSGEIQYNGASTEDWTETRRCEFRARNIGMVFQQFHLLPHHTVMDNLLLRMRYLPASTKVEFSPEDLLEEVGLTQQSSQPARTLSGGEKQRLCIARAMLLQPDLFLADEPTGNLDERSAGKVKDLFTRVSEKGATLVIATHDERWLDFATCGYRLENGRIQEISS